MSSDEKDYARDKISRALINTNKDALNDRKFKRDILHRLEKLEADVSNILAILHNTTIDRDQ